MTSRSAWRRMAPAASRNRAGLVVVVLDRAEGVLDPAQRLFLAAVEDLGVDLEQHVDAVACPLSDLGGVIAAGQPCGDSCMAEIVGTASQRRPGGLHLAEGPRSGALPDADVHDRGQPPRRALRQRLGRLRVDSVNGRG